MEDNETIEEGPQQPESIIKVVDQAITLITDPELEDSDRANAIIDLFTNDPELEDELRQKGSAVTFHASENLIQVGHNYFNKGDSIQLIELVLVNTLNRQAKPLSQFYRDNGLKTSGSDAGAYLKEKGVTSERSRMVYAFEQQVKDTEEAQIYLDKFLQRNSPDAFKLLSFEGSSAVIFASETKPTVYKVYKPDLHSPDTNGSMLSEDLIQYIGEEVANIRLLEESGLSPRFISSNLDNQFNLDGTVIVEMERIEHEPITTQAEDVRKSEAERISQILLSLHVLPGDTDFVWDTKNQTTRMVDLAGIVVDDGVTLQKIKEYMNLINYFGIKV